VASHSSRRKIEALCRELKESGRHITIETAGTIFKPIGCDLISVSPKLANSTPWRRQGGKFALPHEKQRLNLPVIQKFLDKYDYQFKIVVAEKKDFAEIAEILEQLKTVERSRVPDHGRGENHRAPARQRTLDRRAVQTLWVPIYTPLAHRTLWQSARHVKA
jgi:7-carboxy-7-deazaguanine synthase